MDWNAAIGPGINWNLAIERNREALKRILASLVAMAGLAGAGSRGQFTFFPQKGAMSQDVAQAEKSKLSPAPTLPRHLHRAVLRLLRPAEAAARRLVIVAARGLVVPPPTALRPRKPKLIPTEPLLRSLGIAVVVSPADLARAAAARCAAAIRAARPRTLSLPLLDTLRLPRLVRRPPASGVPRILFPGFSTPFPVPVRRPPSPHDPIDAARLAQRLAALARVLDDLPGHARRFARWKARVAGAQNRKSGDAGRARRRWPLRPGRPPGHHPANGRQPVHEVHDILDNTHGLALDVLRRPDTS